jgi:hypothetical protein
MENNTRASALFNIGHHSTVRAFLRRPFPRSIGGHRTEPPESLIGRASRASPALAPIDQDAQPATVGRSLKTAEAVNKGRGLRSAVSNPSTQPGGFFFSLCRARQAVDTAVQPDASRVLAVRKIWRPTAARTFFQCEEGERS